MSYFKLINGIKEIFEGDGRVNTITEGYVTDFDAYKQNISPMAHIVIDNGTIEENLNFYSVEVMVVDIVVENNNPTIEKFIGNDNHQEVYNNMDNIARRFFMIFKKNSVGQDIFIEGSPTIDKIEETETENRLAGWRISFNVGVPSEEIDIC